MFDALSPERLDLRTKSFTGTSNWIRLSQDLVVGPRTNLVTVQLCRRPSEKFDNRIAGSAWIDSVTFGPARF